ncbi:unnamed protein product [Rotaria magnacalcarata]|uniref:Uncharacterized protein n=1 Tax=Rotaria magnacalcarata TaxID=392030 RepID=A0A820AEU4_9BILA|nr:unnamed protein product [Rotaria magnacalcarata]CAF2044000.1 unnamed protein product [Rotaria magnacalcarata]CAF4173192.1 unnamed protein product [Rotaria magnacalcarata]CAF4190807.1 unnamed protein product [Rotaria magnacalcarata]
MCVVIWLALILYLAYRLYQHLCPSPNINPHGKYVLISGCDTGFGHALAIELDKQGFNVFAAVYNPNNKLSVTSELSARATVFDPDITLENDIDAAYDIVKDKTDTLHALVNNAGIGQGGLIDWGSLESIRNIMNVNFFGHVAMAKKFLPLLLVRRDSRVITICSASGYLAKPSMPAYCSSKFAFESFSDCLRREMFAWGLHVCIIEPSFMRTPIIDGHERSLSNLWSKLPSDVKDRWGEDFFDSYVQKVATNPFIQYAENPNKVVRALKHAVTNTVPKIRYRPGWQNLIFFSLSMIPTWLADVIIVTVTNPAVLPAGVKTQIKS